MFSTQSKEKDHTGTGSKHLQDCQWSVEIGFCGDWETQFQPKSLCDIDYIYWVGVTHTLQTTCTFCDDNNRV